MTETPKTQTESRVREHDITEEDTLVFLHIPKTAGTTLGTLIDPMWLPHKRAKVYLMRELATATLADVVPAQSFVGHFYLDALASLLERPFETITVLREPIARYISGFYQVQREQVERTPREQAAWEKFRSMSLDEFVEHPGISRKNAMSNQQTRRIAAPLPVKELRAIPLLLQQENKDAPQLPVSDACDQLASLAFFGLTERFQESLWMLSFIFGWYPLENRLTFNRAPKPTDARAVAPGTLKQIHAFNTKDIELYEFAGKLFDRRYEWLMETLCERYGTARHARAPLPLAAEIIHELLVRHFQSRLARRRTQRPSQTLRFNFLENTESAQGWHGLEKSHLGPYFRWTGPARSSSLILPRPAETDLELRFCVLHVVKPDVLEGVQLRANGTELAWTRTVQPDRTSMYQAQIPAHVVRTSPFVRLEWQVAQTLRPIDVEENNSDDRELGLAISWVELEPRPGRATAELQGVLAPAE